jgi:hypothetical protein
MWFAQVRLAACACVSGPKLARARTCAGSSPSHHGHCLACATYSVTTTGGGAGPKSVTWWRRCAMTGAPARPVPHSRHDAGGNHDR